MKSFRLALLALCLLFGYTSPALARVDIDINLSLYPDLVPIPGYPVYYAPRVGYNYFFYEGRYWIFEDDNWFVSDWYNGPWDYVDPYDVPVFVLRVPVRYYRRPPPYFRGWYVDAPPRWGYHWGDRWEHDHRGWDHWDRRNIPAPARLPLYQRDYRGDRYPSRSEQRDLRERYYDNRNDHDHDRRNDHDRDREKNKPQRGNDDHDWNERNRPARIGGAPQPIHRDYNRDYNRDDDSPNSDDRKPQPQQRIPQVHRNPGDGQRWPGNAEHRASENTERGAPENRERPNARPQRDNSTEERGPGKNRDDNRQIFQRGNGADKNDGGRGNDR